MTRRFRPNVLLCLSLHDMSPGTLGGILWGHLGGRPDTHRRRLHRLLMGSTRGGVRVTLNDVERIAVVFAVPPDVLAYGSADQIKSELKKRGWTL